MAKKKKNKSKRSFSTNFKKAVVRDTERQEKAQKSFGYLNIPKGIPIFNAEPGGRHKLDIMPYVVTDAAHPDRYEDEGIAVEGELWYKRPFKIHKNIGVGKDAVICPRSFGKKCPICDYMEKRLKEGADWEDVKELKVSDRNLYVVIPRGSKDHEEVPHIWDISQYLFQNLLNTELKEDEDYAVFPDLEEGLTLRIRFDSSTIGDSKPFAEASRIDFYERKEIYDESILDDIPNLDDVLQQLTYKELEAKFMEIDDSDYADEDIEEDEEFEEEEEAPKRRKKSASKKRSKKKSKPEPEPEPEPEEEEEFEDEEFDDEEEFEEEFEEEDDEEFEDEMAEDEFGDEFEDEEFDEEFEDEFEDEFEEEEEEEPETPKRTKKASKTKSKRRKK